MMLSNGWMVLGAVALAAAAPRPLPAQRSTTIVGVQDLSFGSLTPGVSEAVPVTDTWRRAEIRLQGTGQFNVRFVLPTQLSGTRGTPIPLTFASGDAAYSTAKDARLSTFSPSTGAKINLTSGGGSATIYLGGTAKPVAGQAAGKYTATVVVIIAPPNS